MDEQRQLILDQFTRQAVPFSQLHARDDAEIYDHEYPESQWCQSGL